MGFISLILMPFIDVAGFLIDIYFKIVAVDVILYWLLRYKIISVHNKYAEKFMELLHLVTEPAYRLIRKKVPPLAGHDISPYVLLLILALLGSFITHLGMWLTQSM